MSSAPKTLILSQRGTSSKVYQCVLYEFEDTIAAVTEATMIAPAPQADRSRWDAPMRRLRNGLARATNRPGSLRTTSSTETVRENYDIFFAAFLYPSQILSLNHVEGWIEHCKTKICFLGEVWLRQFNDPTQRQFLELLKPFDHIFLHTGSSIAKLGEVTGRPCHVSPGAVDASRFHPGHPAPRRCTDVYSMGRRSEATHRALMAAAEGGDFFYLYDTAGGFDVLSPREHRLLLANVIKRSRYFIAYSHNTNITDITGGQEELGARLFEGTAGGSILLGQAPRNEAFREHFGWDDAVVPIPFEAPHIFEIIRELDAEPGRVARARHQNVTNALLRHDWIYRWRRMLEVAGLPPGPRAEERVRRLRTLAEQTRVE